MKKENPFNQSVEGSLETKSTAQLQREVHAILKANIEDPPSLSGVSFVETKDTANEDTPQSD